MSCRKLQINKKAIDYLEYKMSRCVSNRLNYYGMRNAAMGYTTGGGGGGGGEMHH